MAEVIRMPRLSDTMAEGVIVSWNKKVGDKIKPGDVLADVETDKATMELESYNEGVLLYIGVEAGKAAKVDGVLAVVGKAGEDYKAALDAAGNNETAKPAAAEPTKTETVKAEASVAAPAAAKVALTGWRKRNQDAFVK
jgi:pyruvate dehydrogenase E2 component (dihydrolipoamide acetyltransferase)